MISLPKPVPTVVVCSLTSIQEAGGKRFQSFIGQLPRHSTRQRMQSNHSFVTEHIETTASVSYHNTNYRSSVQKGCTTCVPAGQPRETYMTVTTDKQNSHNRPTGQPQQTNRTTTTDQQNSHNRPTEQQNSHNRPTGQPQQTNRTATTDQQDSQTDHQWSHMKQGSTAAGGQRKQTRRSRVSAPVTSCCHHCPHCQGTFLTRTQWTYF